MAFDDDLGAPLPRYTSHSTVRQGRPPASISVLLCGCCNMREQEFH